MVLEYAGWAAALGGVLVGGVQHARALAMQRERDRARADVERVRYDLGKVQHDLGGARRHVDAAREVRAAAEAVLQKGGCRDCREKRLTDAIAAYDKGRWY